MTRKQLLDLVFETQKDVNRLQVSLQEIAKGIASDYIEDSMVIPDSSVERNSQTQGVNNELHFYDLFNPKYRGTKPSILVCENGEKQIVNSWKELVIKFAQYLIENGYIKEDVPQKRKHPVIAGERERLSQTHGNPKSYIVQIGEHYVDTWGNVGTKARRLIEICESVGIPHENFGVILRPRGG